MLLIITAHIRPNVVFLALVVLVELPDSKGINLGGNSI